MSDARFVLIGGFLGAGKTTAIRKYVEWLRKRGLKAAVITNDQAEGLVDSRLMETSGIPTEEIAGGCFCCRSDLLVQTADKIVQDFDPDIIIAEPVGSCTDLVATVSLPIEQVFKRSFVIAPLTVMVDPLRAERVLRRERSQAPEESDVDYIYLKQLEEAGIIVINKSELMAPERLRNLEAELAGRFPQATQLTVSTRKDMNLEAWWQIISTTRHQTARTMPLDYDRYARGEAELGWLNAQFQIEGGPLFDLNDALERLTKAMTEECRRMGAMVAHLKIWCQPKNARDAGAAVIQWVDSDREPEFTSRCSGEYSSADLSINLRARAEPSSLEKLVESSLLVAWPGNKVQRGVLAAFAPAAPNPVHRVALSND